MKTEAAKGLVRISSNYARLGVNLVQGIIFLPFALHWLGNEPVGLIGLLGAGTGLAVMFREIADRTVVRELGAAHHTGDQEHFKRTYNSSLLLCLVLAGVVFTLICAVMLVVPLLNIGVPLRNPARVLVATQGLFNVLVTILSPILTMQLIRERFILYNVWIVADRSSMLLGAVAVRYGMHIMDPARALTAWSIVVMIIQIAAMSAPAAILLAGDPRLRPRFSLASWKQARSLFGTARWYLGFTISENMYERAGSVLTNLFLGLSANAVFYAAAQVVAYISQAAVGVSQGLDAVSARLETKGGRSLQALVFHSTRLVGLASIPAGVAFFVLAPDLVRLWLGKTLENPDTNIPLVVTNARIMCLPLVVRSVGFGWTAILYGAGFLRRYAPMVFFSALCNPVLTALALLLWRRVETVSIIFAVVYTIIFFVLLPRVGARCLDMKMRDMFTPMIRPLLATAICTPILLLAPVQLERIGLGPAQRLLVTGSLFGGAYAIAAALIVLTPDERDRFMWAPLRRIFRSPR